MKKIKKTESEGDMDGVKKITMWEIDVEIDDVVYKKIVDMGRKLIQSDERALFNYAANKCLKGFIEKKEKASHK